MTAPRTSVFAPMFIAGGVEVTSSGRRFHGAAPGASLVAIAAGQVVPTIFAASVALNWIVEHHAEPCGGSVARLSPDPSRACDRAECAEPELAARAQDHVARD